jgi:hypothetical protein
MYDEDTTEIPKMKIKAPGEEILNDANVYLLEFRREGERKRDGTILGRISKKEGNKLARMSKREGNKLARMSIRDGTRLARMSKRGQNKRNQILRIV